MSSEVNFIGEKRNSTTPNLIILKHLNNSSILIQENH